MKIVVLDAATLGVDLDLTPLFSVGDVTIYPETAAAQIAERTRDADIIVANKARLNAVCLGGAERLKLITVTATGYDNIDLDFCRARGIGVANVPAYSTDSVAQVTIATVLELATHLNAYRTHVADGTYSRGQSFNLLTPVYHELAGKTWGIIGFGNIGARVAKVAEALGCRVVAYTRTPRAGVDCVSLDTLCRESDVITVHVPLTDATRRMIDAHTLDIMKDGVILVNMARGAVLDEAAVTEAVCAGRILFGCDVYSKEPFDDKHSYSRIRDMDNVVLTPHMAWGAFEARTRCLAEIVENIKAFICGERRNRVD